MVRSSKVVLTILCFEIQWISSAVKIPHSPLLFSYVKKSAVDASCSMMQIVHVAGLESPKKGQTIQLHLFYKLCSMGNPEVLWLREGADLFSEGGFEA